MLLNVADYEMFAFYDLKHTFVVEGNLLYAKLCLISYKDDQIFGENLQGQLRESV